MDALKANNKNDKHFVHRASSTVEDDARLNFSRNLLITHKQQCQYTCKRKSMRETITEKHNEKKSVSKSHPAMVTDKLIWDMRDQPLRTALCRLDKTINRSHKRRKRENPEMRHRHHRCHQGDARLTPHPHTAEKNPGRRAA